MAADRFLPGDHLWKNGGRLGGFIYDHHLIYKEPNQDGTHSIIENSFRRGRVVEKCISDQRLLTLELYERPEDPGVCLQRAEAALGKKYYLLNNNCETFANACVRGDFGASSRQIRVATGHMALAGATCCGLGIVGCVGLAHTHTVVTSVPYR